jgi:hypothetical protein
MSRSFLTSINLNQNQLLNAVLHNLPAPPSNPMPGQIYFDTVQLGEFVWNGTAWVPSDASKLVGTIPNAALQTNPLARANHTGTQLASTISNLQATVDTYRLSEFALPNANIAMGGFKFTNLSTTPSNPGDSVEYSWLLSRPLNSFAPPTASIPMNGYTFTNLATPTTAGQAATYEWVIGQVQSAAAGIASKFPVQAITTANSTLTGLQTIDGYTMVAGDRILVTGQTTASANGVYNAATGAWTRTTIDGAAPGELEPGALWLVVNGTMYGGSQWRCANTGAIVVGTTAVSVIQFAVSNIYAAGYGLSLTGQTFALNPVAGGGILASTAGAQIDTTIVARKFSTTIGDGSTLNYVVTHNLGTQDVMMQVKQTAAPYAEVEVDMLATSTTTATFSFAVPPASGAYRVIVVG